jgi:hypothetical protein
MATPLPTRRGNHTTPRLSLRYSNGISYRCDHYIGRVLNVNSFIAIFLQKYISFKADTYYLIVLLNIKYFFDNYYLFIYPNKLG